MNRFFSNNSESSKQLLSIVTVSFNDADRLLRTIQSLMPFYGDLRYEHIIIDGGSTDGTLDFLNLYPKQNNLCFYSAPDDGIYDAMNKGSVLCSGKFILFLNCGDRMLVEPNNLAKYLEDLYENSWDIVCHPFKEIGGQTAKVIYPKKLEKYKLPASHQAMLFSNKFIKAHKYDLRYKIASDYDLYLHACCRRILISGLKTPFVSVEVNGIASQSPMTAYKEYFLIAFRNLGGIARVTSLIYIAGKAIIVIPIKYIFPRSWINLLRLAY